MATPVQDSIERKLVFKADRERVWKCVSDPAEIVKWFCERIEGDFAVGEEVMLCWGDDRCGAKVVTLDPPNQMAYRWVPGVGDGVTQLTHQNSTLVLFTLRDVADGVELEMIESGFASLPEEMKAHALRENTSGWDSELGHLVEYLG